MGFPGVIDSTVGIVARQILFGLTRRRHGSVGAEMAPNSSWNDFGSAIGRLLSAIAKLMRYKRVQAAVKHSFRALEE